MRDVKLDHRACPALLVATIAMGWVMGAMSASGEGFIRSMGTRFVDKHCQDYAYSGFNSWELMEAAAGLQKALPPDQTHLMGETLVQWVFETARQNQMLVGRFFGHGHNWDLPLQFQPGDYNEVALNALDRVLSEARNKGVKVVITLADNWQEVDSKEAYAFWAGKSSDEFYTDTTMKQWFKNHIAFMVNRINSHTGIRYGDDDCIISWNLMNEPRCNCDVSAYTDACKPECADDMQAWIEEMSLYLKELDPIHMVTVGEEGFYSFNSGREDVNPDASAGRPEDELWALRSGQDFLRNHNLAEIDYAAIHSWPDNWGIRSIPFQEKWVREHIADAEWLNKPLVVEEFGKEVERNDDGSRRSVRDPFFFSMYSMFLSEMAADSPLKGVGFWEFDANNNYDPLDYGVQTTHSTWNDIIVPSSHLLMDSLSKRPLVENCIPGGFRAADAIMIGGASTTYYMSNGPSILDVDEGIDAADIMAFSTPAQCAQLCESIADCDSFSFNPKQDGGTCVAKKGARASGASRWNPDGWQTFYRMKGSKECSLTGCEICTSTDTCLKCEKGTLLFRSGDGELSCASCDSALESIRDKREECRGTGSSAQLERL